MTVIYMSSPLQCGIPEFKYYALGDGLKAIFERTQGKLPIKPLPTNQIDIGFTQKFSR